MMNYRLRIKSASQHWSLLVILLLSSCKIDKDGGSKSKNEFADKLPKIAFEKDANGFDFGDLTEGQVVEHTFRFKNVGEFPLILNNVTASCGCTIPEWPREPIGPDESNTIKVRFNTKGKRGPQAKSIMVYANTDPAFAEIRFTATVYPSKDSTKTK